MNNLGWSCSLSEINNNNNNYEIKLMFEMNN